MKKVALTEWECLPDREPAHALVAGATGRWLILEDARQWIPAGARMTRSNYDFFLI
jgi:hypothetical protein